jgi:hypothetical protein
MALGYGLDDWGFKSLQGLRIFLFTTMSIPDLRPTQPPIQWVPGTLYLGVKQPGHEADHPPLSSAEVKNVCARTCVCVCVCVGLYLHTPVHLHGVVLR